MGGVARRCCLCQGVQRPGTCHSLVPVGAPCHLLPLCPVWWCCLCTQCGGVASVSSVVVLPSLMCISPAQVDAFGAVAMDGLQLSSGHGDLMSTMEVEGRTCGCRCVIRVGAAV